MSCELSRLFLTCHPWPQVETLSNGGWENWGKSWRLVDPLTADSQELLMEPHQQNIWKKKVTNGRGSWFPEIVEIQLETSMMKVLVCFFTHPGNFFTFSASRSLTVFLLAASYFQVGTVPGSCMIIYHLKNTGVAKPPPLKTCNWEM